MRNTEKMSNNKKVQHQLLATAPKANTVVSELETVTYLLYISNNCILKLTWI